MTALPSLPRLPGLGLPGRRAPKPKLPKLDYSIDLEGTRKKRKKVSLDELNQRGAEALREHPDLQSPDSRGAATKVLDALDVDRNAVANAIARVIGMNTSKLPKATFQPRVNMSDVLGHLGVQPGAVRSIVGFIGDLAIDPKTYITLGASAGATAVRGLPKLVGAGRRSFELAAKTGKIGAELAPALGGATRAARMARGVERAKAGYAASQARIAGKLAKGEKVLRIPGAPQVRFRQTLSRGLERGVRKGRAETVDLFEQYGIKGRPLIRAPFGERGILPLPGKQKRAYQAVVKAKEEGEGFARIAATKAQRTAQAVTAASAAKRAAGIPAELRSARDLRALEIAKAQVGLSGRTVQEARAAGKQGVQAVRAKGKALTTEAEQAEAASVAAKNELKRLRTAPETPGVIRSIEEAAIGRPYVKGPTGVLGALGQAKRTIFGPGPSPIHQREVAAVERYGPRAAITGLRVTAELSRRMEPIVQKYARAGVGTPDEVKKVMFRLVDMGPNPTPESMATAFHWQDPIYKTYVKATDSGMLRDPAVQNVLKAHAEMQQGFHAAEKARGVAQGEVEDYAHRILTKEARRPVGQQQARGATKPGAKPGGRFSTARPPSIGRTKLLTVTLPDGTIRTVLDSNEKELQALLSAGGKVTGRNDISAAQFNEWTQTGHGPKGILGPTPPGQKPFRGPMFEEDLAKSAGARAAEHERAMAAADVQELVEKYGVDVPKDIGDKAQAYAHLVRPTKPIEPNPFAKMDPRLFDRMYPPQVADILNRVTAVAGNDQAVGSVIAASDTVLGWWKRIALYHPAYVTRNIFQDLFGALMAGANPARVAQLSMSSEVGRLRTALAAANPAALGTGSIAGHSLASLYQLAPRLNMVGVGRTEQQIGRTGLEVAKAGTAKVTGVIYRANQHLEDRLRLSTWIGFMEKGMNPEDAAMRTIQAMPDLSDLTLIERHVMSRVFPWYRWCVPDDHRILTRDGWKTVDDLRVGEEVLTYNVEKDVSEWQPIKEVAVFPYDGMLMTLKGKLDYFAFTPDHRWPVMSHTRRGGVDIRGVRKMVCGYQLRASHSIPCSAPHIFPATHSDVTSREAAILGWIVTDGHMRLRRGTYWDAVIYQKKTRHLATIRGLLGEDARSEATDARCDCITFRMSSRLAKRMGTICPNKRNLPGIVTRLSREAGQAMWGAMMAAEGSIHPRAGTKFTQNPGPVLHAFQILTTILGKSAETPGRADKGDDLKYCYIAQSREGLKVSGILGTEQYKGRVWCPVTDNGTWFMEHNGRIIITGNTRRNGALQIFHYLPQKPAFAAMLPRFKTFLEGLRGDENVPDELRPAWMKDQLSAQLTGTKAGGTAVSLSSWFPFEQLHQIGELATGPQEAFRGVVGQLRPGARFGIEMATGVNTFRGTQYPAFDATDLVGAIPQAIVGRSNTPMDTLLTARPIREIGRTREMPSPAAMGARVALGGALQPLDYQRGLVDRYYQLDKLQRTLRAQYNRAMAANDKALADSLLRQWVAAVKQMGQYKMPLPRKTETMLAGAGVQRTGPP